LFNTYITNTDNALKVWWLRSSNGACFHLYFKLNVIQLLLGLKCFVWSVCRSSVARRWYTWWYTVFALFLILFSSTHLFTSHHEMWF